MVSMSVHVYQAEDLPPMHTDISNQFRQAFVGEGAANVDPYVEVTYAGFTVSFSSVLSEKLTYLFFTQTLDDQSLFKIDLAR